MTSIEHESSRAMRCRLCSPSFVASYGASAARIAASAGEIYKQIANQVETGQNALRSLVNERGSAKLNVTGNVQFGSWVVKGDHSVVDKIKKLTGADATIFEMHAGINTGMPLAAMPEADADLQYVERVVKSDRHVVHGNDSQPVRPHLRRCYG